MKPFFIAGKRLAGKGGSWRKLSFCGSLGRVTLAFATCAILCFLLSVHLLPNKVSLRVGDISPDSIVARRTVSYEDKQETDLRRIQASIKVGRAFDPVPGATEHSMSALRTVIQTVEAVRMSAPKDAPEELVTTLRAKLGPALGRQVSDTTLKTVLGLTPSELRQVEDLANRLVSSASAKDIEDDPAALHIARDSILSEALSSSQDRGAALAAGELAADAIRPNRAISSARTAALVERAKNSVQPVYRQIVPGQIIISKGEPVLQDHIAKFEALGLRNPSIDFAAFASLSLFVVLGIFLVNLYLRHFHEDIHSNISDLILLSVVVVLSTLALRISGSLLGLELSPAQVGYMGLTCVVTAGMLLSVLFNTSLAVVVTALLSIVLSLTLHSDLQFAANALITSLVGIHAVARLRNISDLTRAVGFLSGTGMALVWITGGISGQPISQLLSGTFWAGVATPLGSAILFLLGTCLGRPFDRITHIYLLELADTNRPLLKRLVMEAPGTYTHSVLCAYLADAAAEAIGADSLLARVGAYYHDVGKIRRPHFFIENQHVENVHDRLSPTLSVLVILSHIKDGLEVGREYKLPKVILDIIAQHQGTSLVQYFYHQLGDHHDRPEEMEQRFRYPGPKPQTKESAIVMLADVVEAASHSQDKPTAATIEAMVEKVVGDKFRDGQLDESDLSFKEVRIISERFVKALMGTLHARIEYPDVFSAIGKKIEIDAGTGSESTELPDSSEQTQEAGAAVTAG